MEKRNYWLKLKKNLIFELEKLKTENKTLQTENKELKDRLINKYVDAEDDEFP